MTAIAYAIKVVPNSAKEPVLAYYRAELGERVVTAFDLESFARLLKRHEVSALETLRESVKPWHFGSQKARLSPIELEKLRLMVLGLPADTNVLLASTPCSQ